MTAIPDWVDNAFFEVPEERSLDGGSTSAGVLWHGVSPRWGHSMHTMCSYHGMFPARLVHFCLQRYSQPNDLVLDPFSGRGTTALQARVEGRRTIANDLNPLAYVLTRAKLSPPPWKRLMQVLDRLEARYKASSQPEPDVPADIRMLFHRQTLRQLLYLRRRLSRKPFSAWTSEEFMLAGAVAGILHGLHREDGTSAYLSISMPNTFSMAPSYVKRFIQENGLLPPHQDVFTLLRNKLARLYLDRPEGARGTAYMDDAIHLLSSSAVRRGTVDLIVTSPPYLGVVNYGAANWIRLWWLGVDDVARNQGAGRRSLDAELDHGHKYASYSAFILRALTAMRRTLSQSGIAVLVVGDVAVPDRPALPLAQRLWEDLREASGLTLLDIVEDLLPAHNKVSRIWGETKGRATDRDCLLILGRNDGKPRVPFSTCDWDEPYKDAGPDAAHNLVARSR